jgi:ABC-type antimicrobial peptide transport system permease subunit
MNPLLALSALCFAIGAIGIFNTLLPDLEQPKDED